MSLPYLPIHTSQTSTIARANQSQTMSSDKTNEDTVNTMLDVNSQPGTTGSIGAGSEGDSGRVSVMAMAKLFEQLLFKKREADVEPNAKRICQRPGRGSLNPALIERFEPTKRSLQKVAPITEKAEVLTTMPEFQDASRYFPTSVPEMQQEQRRDEPEMRQESCMVSHSTATPSQKVDCSDLSFHDVPMPVEAAVSNLGIKDDSPECCASSGAVQVKRKVSEMNLEDAYGTTIYPCENSLTERCDSTCGMSKLTRQYGNHETKASALPASYLLGRRPPPKPQRLFLYPYVARAGGGDGETLSNPAVNKCDGVGSKTPTNLTADGVSSSNPFDYQSGNSKNVSVELGAASSSKRRVSSRFGRWLRRKVFVRSRMKAAQKELDPTYVNFDEEINAEAIPVLLPQQDDKGVSPIPSSSREAINERKLTRLRIADSDVVENSYIDVQSVDLSSDEEESKSMETDTTSLTVELESSIFDSHRAKN